MAAMVGRDPILQQVEAVVHLLLVEMEPLTGVLAALVLPQVLAVHL
jgi:hypothetical protein